MYIEGVTFLEKAILCAQSFISSVDKHMVNQDWLQVVTKKEWYIHMMARHYVSTEDEASLLFRLHLNTVSNHSHSLDESDKRLAIVVCEEKV
jgi:hypothetical protein